MRLRAIGSMTRLREMQQRIAWIEAHPAFSDWLKGVLRSAIERDPVDIMNDLEILDHVLGGWAAASIDVGRKAAENDPGDRI